ncbi:MAG: YbjQ family protein [Acidobacteria bacterium]|nr:YbjQ family protein [Acidobacteriota bacterium]MXX87164.1 YbjQ family protein [Acidobacteriota bacterium]MYE43250.1 YbjQ family protein [Acidobacteriota bacterium]MYF76401.1 YbjQ family protein [Acidobacteriota bacterium]MYG75836.1 YbjQ family protein [Acidobacteriota bacterium]
MIVSTTNEVPGAEIGEVLGIARGNTIRARHLGRDIMAGLKGVVGGEVESYTKLMAESREQAIARMIEHAEALGADAIVGMRIATSVLMTTAAEILAYGTAVKVRR